MNRPKSITARKL